MFSLNQLRNFVMVAEELHFGRAAERLKMTQPPLSRQIQLLERELGVELFDRSNRSVRLTPAGEAFLREARSVLANAQRAIHDARLAASGARGVVNLGFTAASANAGLGTVLSTAASHLPGVEIVLYEMVSDEQIDALHHRSLDIGLTRPAGNRSELQTHTVFSEPLVLAAPVGHPLVDGSGRVELRQLDGVEIIMYSPSRSRYFYETLISLFNRAQIAPKVVQTLNQVHSILSLVNLSWGAAFVPASAARMKFDNIKYLEIVDSPDDLIKVEMVWPEHLENPAARNLIELLR